MPQYRSILQQYWGYDNFRPLQHDIIQSFGSGKDTLGLMPTGGGKSITFQVPALTKDGLCLVITPLIALMKDQVANLRAKNIKAAAIYSGMENIDVQKTFDNCIYGHYKFLYLSPERLSSKLFLEKLPLLSVSMIAVDEAHCISQWGYDFRPSYLEIANLRKLLPHVPVLAVTATATPQVAYDIQRQLLFEHINVFRKSFYRPNLSYSTRECENKETQLLRILNNVPGSSIVYVRNRKKTKEIAELLTAQGISAQFFHAGLPLAEKDQRQDAWQKGACRVMVATNAFGMGIDKPDVRFVVHYTMCDSLESYYQEAGRAGRDGKRSYALLLTAPDDPQRIVTRFDQEFPPLERVKDIYEQLCSYLQIPIGEGKDCSMIFNIYDFCIHNHLYEGMVKCTLKLLQLNGYLTLTDTQENPARVMFTVGRDDLYRIRLNRSDLDPFIRVLLRLYPGIFNDFKAIDESEIATWSGYTIDRVRELLRRLWQLRVIRYIPSNRSPMIYLHEERLPREDIYIAPETYRRRQELMHERFEQMLQYAQNETQCRSAVLDRYFGASHDHQCGICDICLQRKREERIRKGERQADEVTLRNQILEALQHASLEPQALIQQLNGSPERLTDLLRDLLEKGEILQTAEGTLKITHS